MTEDKSYYERSNISIGNDITDSNSYFINSYRTSLGRWGTFRNLSGNFMEDYPVIEDGDKITYIDRFKSEHSDFAENYQKDGTAYAFYELGIKGEKEIIISDGTPKTSEDNESRMLDVFIVNEIEYNNLINQIDLVSEYEGIQKQKYGDEFKIKYKFKEFVIFIEDDKRDKVGGSIKIISGDFYLNQQ